ncbi:MAG: hypothetical protein IPO88_05320 [Nannocystis sp.]|uniref:pseudouridine synthase n=1 Tax=Nannocystis sp. TaxID=1962667 RepID=UPI002424A65B|nr:pseudouridine synthase [Nannocystis sp.]MBK9752921.1 hypothetical protein [Nannocystis sp.]
MNSQATAPHASGPVRFRVVSVEDGMMLRQLLGKRLKVSPTVAAEIVRAGGAYVGIVRMCVPTVRVTEGERVTVYPRAAEIAAIDPGALSLLHRDEQCVIVEKPHGVPAAATRAANRGTLAQALVQRLEAEGVLRPYVGLVHNLPVAAAGLALFTIRGQATESFYQLFAGLPMRRRYRVRLRGSFSGERVVCEVPLCHLLTGGAAGSWRLARAGDREKLAARSEFHKLGELGEETLAVVDGSSADAIRLHARALGLAIVGEDEPSTTATLCLLAEALAFTQPHSGAAVAVRASLPAWALLPGDALASGAPPGLTDAEA